jgi:hypothetical protein
VAETEHFINDGFGWECKHCRRESGVGGAAPSDDGALARFFREGEAEEREPRLSAHATIARWKDETRRTLCCMRCRTEEDIPAGTV